jgi:hypothetical protein
MRKITIFEKVISNSKMITKISLFTVLVFGAFNASAQMKYFLNQTAAHTSTTAVPGDFDIDFDGDGKKEFEINFVTTDNGLTALRIKGRSSPSYGEVLGQADIVTIDGVDFDIPTTTATPPNSASVDETWNTRDTQTILYFDATDSTFGDGNIYGTTGEIYIGVRFITDGTGDLGGVAGETYYGWFQMTITDTENWSINAWAYNAKIDASASIGVPVGDEIHFLNQNLTGGADTPGDFDIDFDGDGSKEFEVNLLDPGILRIKGKKSPSWGEVLGEAATVTFDGDEFDIPTVYGSITTKGPDDLTWNDRNTNTVLYFDTGDTNIGNNGILGQAGEVYLAVNFIKGGEVDDVNNDAFYGWMHLTITDASNWQVNSYGYNPTAMLSPGYTLSTQKNDLDSNVMVFKDNKTLKIKNLPEVSEFRLYSILGQEVKQGVVQKNDATIDLSNLTTGVYILKAVGKTSGKVFSKKIIF